MEITLKYDIQGNEILHKIVEIHAYDHLKGELS